jgi:septal ring factor EnvC (AmiA/AmiB activator)
MSAPPMSAPPVSGPGFGPQPMSAPPSSVPPYAAPPSGPRKGRAATVILAIVAGLLVILGGVMSGLYVTTNGKLEKAEKQVSQRNGTIAANQQEIDRLKADLQSTRDKLTDTQQDLTGTKNDRDEQARQKKVIATCLDKLTTALEAAGRGDKAGFDAASKGLNKVCDEAENYL